MSVPRPLDATPEDEERFARFIGFDGPDPERPFAPGRCWVWTGYCHPSGYGVFHLKTGSVKAHRLSYRIFNGEFNLQWEIDHKCRNTSCVNPEHLEPVPGSLNQRRKHHAIQDSLFPEERYP